MIEIGNMLAVSREASGVTLEEASQDLDIKDVLLENIEDGRIGGFKDIFVLKEYIHKYAKYLGLDADMIIDLFNEYMFEQTSRIPVKEIEEEVKKQVKESTMEMKVVSPYTKECKKHNRNYYILIYISIIIMVILVIIWSVKQITVGNQSTNAIMVVR